MRQNFVIADGKSEYELLAAMKARAQQTGTEVEAVVREILDDVKSRGLEAVNEFSLRLDDSRIHEINAETLIDAYNTCPRGLIKAMEKAAANIYDYQNRLLAKSAVWQSPVEGGVVGQLVRGLSRVGVYIPGGKAAYPSSVLMNIIPAKAAGVVEIIMVTPPTQNLNNAVLAAAKIAGADRVIAVGGAQAIGALAYGAGAVIPRVDKIVGPGNAYVATAKRLVYGLVDIDMIAGPSEVTIIADESANPAFVAADLLSQAEHDEMASAVLLTTSEKLAREVMIEIDRQAQGLERFSIIERSVEDYGAVIVCENIEACAGLANEIAPEHLEIMTEKPSDILPLIQNAGAVFLGGYSPEPLGDYMAGPCHVLPTSGTARFYSPLSALSFVKRSSVIDFSAGALDTLSDDIMALARAEGLTAHANSIAVRRERK